MPRSPAQVTKAWPTPEELPESDLPKTYLFQAISPTSKFYPRVILRGFTQNSYQHSDVLNRCFIITDLIKNAAKIQGWTVEQWESSSFIFSATIPFYIDSETVSCRRLCLQTSPRQHDFQNAMECKNCELKQRQFYCENCLRIQWAQLFTLSFL